MSNYYNRQWRLPNNENKDKQSNYSMDFDGGSKYVDCGTGFGDSLGTYTGDLSFSFWINRPTAANSKGILYFGPFNNRGVLEIYADTSSITILSGGNKVLSYTNANTWDNICIIYKSGDISNSKIYLNGSEQSTTDSGSFSSSLTFTGKKTIIGGYYSSAYTFNGKIDGVSIFDYALTDGTGGTVNQIAALYGSSSTGIGNPMSLSPAPVAYYPLGDQDAFNGAEYLTPNASLKDYVFYFDGSNAQSVNCGNDNSLQATTALTLSAWIKYTTDDTNFRYVLTRRDLNDTNYMLYLNNTTGSKTLKFGSNGTATSSGSVTYNQWHHVAVTVNGTSVSFYIDGQPAGTSTINGINSFADKDFIIGDVSYSTTYEFAGLISNAQIFNTALPEIGSNSVETLYNNGSPLTSMSGFTSLQGWWKLDASATYDGTDWTIPDDSSNSNDGTSSGMTQANLVQSDLSFTSGYSPYALDFDGVNDYIDVSADSSLVLGSGDFTISFWIKTADSTANILNPISSTGAGFFGLMIYQGKLRWNDQYNVSNLWVINNTQIVTNTWINVIVVRNSGTISVFYNNVAQTLTATSDSQNYSGNNGYRIGSGNLGDLDGSLSNFSIWNAALTSSQLTEIYNEGVPSNLNNHSAYSNLVSWWQLGSNSSFNTNWTVLDEKGSNNGTSSNMTEASIVDGVGSYANGLSSGMGGDEVIGDAPYSSSNSLSVNMDALDRTDDTPS